MEPKSKLVKCPRCGKMILDTGGETLTCKYCGALIRREEIEGQRDEDLERKIQIVKLKWEIDMLEKKAKVTQVVALVFIILGIIMLFSPAFKILQIIATVIFFGFGLFMYFVLPQKIDKLREEKKSLRTDLISGR